MKIIYYEDIEEIFRFHCPYKACGALNEVCSSPEKDEVIMCDECGKDIKVKV